MSLGTHPVLDGDVERSFECVGPFVINLHASTAPIALPAKAPACNEHARLYQIQRVDDGRIRYRLRLGAFATEQEADAILAQVRLEYPGALIATAAADDLHAITVAGGKANFAGSPVDPVVAPAPAVVPPAPAIVAPLALVEPVPVLAVAVLTPAPKVTAPAAVVRPAPPVAAPAPAVAPAVPSPPAPAAERRTAPASVAAEFASMQALIAAIDTVPVSNKTTKPPVLHSVPAARAPVAKAPAAKAPAAKAPVRRDVVGAPVAATVPSLESTQTLRPLTPLELGEHEAPRWFVVQLALSDDAFDPDSLPHLDIFSLYRLYTVIGMDQGRLVHALRLGFFAEEVGARAVANYLAAFYDEPIVKRVSVAERDRFADQRVEARKDVGATGRHLAIEITDELVVRGRRSSR
jgi:hypothetical protein